MAENHSRFYHHRVQTELSSDVKMSTDVDPSKSDQLLVHLNISKEYHFVTYHILDDSTQPQLVKSRDRTLGMLIHLDLQQLERPGEAHKIIDDRILPRYWDISPHKRRELIGTVLRKTREAVAGPVPAGHNVLRMGFRLTFVWEDFFDMRPDSAIRRSREEEELIRMVPADEASIGKVMMGRKRKTNEGDCCVVCMDEFSRGCEAVCMPCEHVFHGDCITKWLRTSHFCPVCRFEMPTSCARKKVNLGGI